eukprot:11481926-Alexandrium_andersonii.AAC.1
MGKRAIRPPGTAQGATMAGEFERRAPARWTYSGPGGESGGPEHTCTHAHIHAHTCVQAQRAIALNFV